MDLAILERINNSIDDLKRCFKKDECTSISSYLDENLVVFLDEENRDSVIEKLVDKLANAGKLTDQSAFHTAIMDRERIVSTGIGIGVAIPHAKLPEYSDFFIAIGIQRQKGVEWNALDGSAVRLIFMIGGPDHKQTEYLRILSRLTQAIKDETRRKKLLKALSQSEVIELFKGC